MRHLKDLYDCSGKVAIVTGGYGLYGWPISEALAEAGAQVIIAARSLDKCREAADALKERGYRSEAMPLDQGDEASIVNLVQTVVDRWGRLDILVNNAVLRVANENLDEMTAAEWEKSHRVNATGLALLCRESVRVMRKQKSGSIINISSIQGTVGPHFPVYGDTDMTAPAYYTYEKWGMVGLTKWMANRYGQEKIRVNCISPGGYTPEITKDETNEFVVNYKRLTPMGRFAEEDDIKGPIVFLASDASKYVTGHNLMLDGGWTSW